MRGWEEGGGGREEWGGRETEHEREGEGAKEEGVLILFKVHLPARQH